MIIYRVTNLKNSKIYVGQTIRELKNRLLQHYYDAFNHNSEVAFHRALRKYGFDNFEWKIIDSAETQGELNEKEIYWIEYCNSFGENGYNMTIGGGATSGYTHLEDSKIKMSKAVINRMLTENNTSKLKESDVLAIKELIKDGLTPTEIADKFNVTRYAIGDIKSGRSWSFVGEDVSYIKYPKIKNSKLTDDEISNIKYLIKEGNLNQKEIGELFNITEATIGRIKRGERWLDIGEDISNIKNKKLSNNKLTKNDVIEIKSLLKEDVLTQNEISRKFNVSRATIAKIKSGETWDDVGENVSNIKSPRRNLKLTDEKVKEIKILLKEGTLTQTKIAEMYDVSRKLINRIKLGIAWGHIEVA